MSRDILLEKYQGMSIKEMSKKQTKNYTAEEMSRMHKKYLGIKKMSESQKQISRMLRKCLELLKSNIVK